MLSIRSSRLKQLRRGISNGSTKEIRWIDILPIHDHRSDRESNQSRVVERELNLDRPLTITEDDEFASGYVANFVATISTIALDPSAASVMS